MLLAAATATGLAKDATPNIVQATCSGVATVYGARGKFSSHASLRHASGCMVSSTSYNEVPLKFDHAQNVIPNAIMLVIHYTC